MVVKNIFVLLEAIVLKSLNRFKSGTIIYSVISKIFFDTIER